MIVRGLNKAYVADIRQYVPRTQSYSRCLGSLYFFFLTGDLFRHCEDALVQSIKLLPQATELKVQSLSYPCPEPRLTHRSTVYSRTLAG